MRNFRTVFEFEFFQQIKKKAVIVSTIILAIVAFVVLLQQSSTILTSQLSLIVLRVLPISMTAFLVDTLYRMKISQRH